MISIQSITHPKPYPPITPIVMINAHPTVFYSTVTTYYDEIKSCPKIRGKGEIVEMIETFNSL